jgi:FimV-like protein
VNEEFLERMRERAVGFRGVEGWSVAEADVKAAALVFAEVAREVFGVTLSLEDEDPLQLDGFLNRYVIAPELRPFFEGAQIQTGLSEADYARYVQICEQGTIPEEEALYYFLGAYWGEWLVRHREAKWGLYAPLQPMQKLPDMITTTYGSVCLLPFSQVAKKLADPAADALGYKAGVFQSAYLPPFPLVARLEDRQEAMLALMPHEARLAEEAVRRRDLDTAIHLLDQALQREPEQLFLLMMMQQVAWQAEEWELAHQAMTALLRLRPHARTFFNLGVFYAQFELMDQAVESIRQAILLDPQYDRAKLTLGTLLLELGEKEPAREVLEHLAETGVDPQMQAEAQRLLGEMRW